MSEIHKLFDLDFVEEFFKKKVLPKYLDFIGIKKIVIKPRKDHIWDETYHVVIEYKAQFIDRNRKIKKLSIFCSAHSSEPRKNLYTSLRYLWDNGFGRSYLTVPRPLFYSKTFKATFYRGSSGRNFYHFIRENKLDEIRLTIPKIAAWFAKLHKLPTSGLINFNKRNSRILTTIPSRDKILADVGGRYPHYYSTYKNLYNIFTRQEKQFLDSTLQRWLVHGDAHPENIIRVGDNKLSVIDFNDLCLSDFARDLGCFLQQFEFMARRKINNEEFIAEMKDLFLTKYLESAKIEMTDKLRARIDNYYNWTAIRTATFFLLKNEAEPDRAENLINEVLSRVK